MPTTITSAGITFNDATSLTSAVIPANAVGATQIANGSVTAAKLGTTEQRQIAKAWVNFNGADITSANAVSSQQISCNSGSTTGTFVSISWDASNIGTIYRITQINGVSGATLGGVDVSTLGIQIISLVNSTTATFRFISGTTTSAQSVTGTGSSSSGFSFNSIGIRSSYNVSSVTKNGTGDYTVNFATPMADANYSVSCTGSGLGVQSVLICRFTLSQLTAPSTNSIRVAASNGSGANATDDSFYSVQIFGN